MYWIKAWQRGESGIGFRNVMCDVDAWIELSRCFVLFMGVYNISHKDTAPGSEGKVEGGGEVADISMLCGGAGLLLDGETMDDA